MKERRSQAVYDEDYAAIYDSIWGTERPQQDLQRLAGVLDQVGQYERILDVGCGTGTLCGLLSHTHPRVEGLDVSLPMLMEARRKHPELHFTEGDLLDASLYPADVFSLIVSEWDVINYLESHDEYETAFSNFRSWLRTGGWLCLELLVDEGDSGEGPGALQSVLVDSEQLFVEGGWDLRESANLVFEERIVTPRYTRRNPHRLLLLPPEDVVHLLQSSGFAISRNVGDSRNPFFCCRAT